LPLPDLMRKIGDSDHAKQSARCPFHEDEHASFSVFHKDSAWFWKCHAGCGHGDGVDYLKKRKGLSTRDAIALYCREAGLNGATESVDDGTETFDWPQYVFALTADAKRNLSDWRGFSPGFVEWLHSEKVAGIYRGKIALAVHKAGQVVGCHYLADRGKKLWRYYPKGNGTQPLVFGDVKAATKVLCFESQWDAFAVMDKLGWHEKAQTGTAVFITRGSENSKLIRGKCDRAAVIYAFVQNDEAKPDGTIPAEVWLANLAANAGCKVMRVVTPAAHKDANDWTCAGATKADIEIAMSDAKPVETAQNSAAPTVSQPRPDGDRFIILPSGDVSYSESAREIFARIAPSHKLFYRGGALAELVRDDDFARLDVVKPDAFRSRVERHGTLLAWRTGANGEPVLSPTRMSGEQSKALVLAAEAREILPSVAAVLNCPVLVEVEGKAEVLARGYHARNGGLLILEGDTPPSIPTTEAVSALMRMVEQFDFLTSGDHSRALAALITPALRIGGFLPGRIPIDIGEADQSQSGKGFRNDLTCALYNETSYFVTARNGGVGSTDESFAAALIAGRPIICLDNFRGKIDSQNLEAFLTCPGLFPARIPHRGEVQIDPRHFILQMTSNGVETTRDLANRASIVRIRKRTGFAYRDILGEVKARQPYYLGCVFSVIAAWIAAGKPRTSETRHDFRDWSQMLDWMIQNILKAAPLMDGHEAAQERVSNPARSWLRSVALVLDGDNRLGVPVIASDIVELCDAHEIAIPGLKSSDEPTARRKVGILMASLFGNGHAVEVDGYRVHRETAFHHRAEGGPVDVKTYTFARL